MVKSALNNTILYGIGSLVKACASFFLLPLYTSILGAKQYGQLSVLQTASIIISTCITLALERSLYRLYHDYKTEDGKIKFLSTVFIAINGIGLLVVALFVLFGNYLTPYLGEVDFMSGLFPVVLYSYVNALINYCQIILQTKQEGTKYLFVSLLFVAIYNILCIIMLYYYSPTYHSMVYATLVTTLLVLPFSFLMVKNQIKLFFRWEIMKSVLSFTLPVLGMIIFAWVLNFSDRLFLTNLANLEDVGLYSFAAKIVSIIPLFCGAIFQSYTPYFFTVSNTLSYEQAKEKLIPINDTIVFIVCVLCIAMAIIYNLLLHTVFSAEYLSSIEFFYFLLIGSLVGQQTGILNVMIYQNKKTGRLAQITIFCGLLSVCFNLLLIISIGRIGSAISNLIVSLIMVLATYLFAKKEYYIPYNNNLLLCGVLTIIMESICDFLIESIIIQTTLKIVLAFLFIYSVHKKHIISFSLVRKMVGQLIPGTNNK